jgi:hypothetical protein
MRRVGGLAHSKQIVQPAVGILEEGSVSIVFSHDALDLTCRYVPVRGRCRWGGRWILVEGEGAGTKGALRMSPRFG